jgi:hypothetical protein
MQAGQPRCPPAAASCWINLRLQTVRAYAYSEKLTRIQNNERLLTLHACLLVLTSCDLMMTTSNRLLPYTCCSSKFN